MLENLFLCAFFICVAGTFFFLVGGIYWVLEKIGFNRWLRGWLWFFGLIDECPDAERDR